MARLDPEGKDPALRRMVLIGHSQGGLLVKMQVISSGDRIWNAVSRKPLDELQLVRRDPRPAPAGAVRRAAARSLARGVHLHAASGQLRGGAQYHRQPRPAAPDPALRPHRGGGGPRPEPGRLRGRGEPGRPVGGRQHVAAAPLHPGPAGDPRRAVRHGPLHHRGRGGRPGRAGRRRRGGRTRAPTSSRSSPSWSCGRAIPCRAIPTPSRRCAGSCGSMWRRHDRSHRAGRHGQLHHRGRRGRPVRAGERRRGDIRERPHRARRVRAGRAVGPFRAGNHAIEEVRRILRKHVEVP